MAAAVPLVGRLSAEAARRHQCPPLPHRVAVHRDRRQARDFIRREATALGVRTR
jgi:hypothetical protein